MVRGPVYMKRTTPAVLFIASVPEMGGAEHSLLHLLSGCTRIDPVVLCPGGGDLECALREEGIRVVCFPLSPLQKTVNPLTLAALAFRVARFRFYMHTVVRKYGVDLVCANGNISAAYARFLPKRTPRIWFSRDTRGLGRHMAFFLNRAFTRIIVPSELVRTYLRDLGVPEHKTVSIPNPVNRERFYPGEGCREQFGIPQQSFAIGMAAHLAPWKNHLVFLDAAERLCRDFPDIFVVMAGRDITGFNRLYRKKLERRFRETIPENRGVWVQRSFAPENLYRSLNVVVHPVSGEPFGRTVAEAMVCALPVVTGDGGVLSFVEKDVCFHLEKITPDTVYGACVRLYIDEKFRRETAERASRHAGNVFDAQRIAERVEDVLLEEIQ